MVPRAKSLFRRCLENSFYAVFTQGCGSRSSASEVKTSSWGRCRLEPSRRRPVSGSLQTRLQRPNGGALGFPQLAGWGLSR